MVLIGDIENFPDSYLEFKLKVSSPMKADGRISTMAKVTGASSSNGGSSMYGGNIDASV